MFLHYRTNGIEERAVFLIEKGIFPASVSCFITYPQFIPRCRFFTLTEEPRTILAKNSKPSQPKGEIALSIRLAANELQRAM